MVETSEKPPISKLAIAPDLVAYPIPEAERSPSLWPRLVIGAAFLGIGVVAVSIGLSSVIYRLTHATFQDGLVTGRLVRLQAPVNGEVQDFFASSGVDVQAGQVLARIAPGQQQQQTLLQLQGAVSQTTVELAAAQQLLNLLTTQLQSLDRQEQALQTVNTSLATDDVTRQEAIMASAIATAQAARADYQRYQQLLGAGVVSQQQVDNLRAEWQSAQAVVDQARVGINSAETQLGATQQGIGLNAGDNLQQQRMTIMQTIAAQTALTHTLSTQLGTQQQQHQQAQSLYSDRQVVEVEAPFSGVIYSTERETGEQVSRPDVLLTLLDCNTLWVEVLISNQQASKIDTEKPVRVRLAGTTDTLTGEVELIEAISRSDLAKDQTQALTPGIPDQLMGQPLTRVRVAIPPIEEQSQAQHLCGIGQTTQVTFGMKGFGRF
jgi:multidrug resistance efflux pump